MRRWLPGADQTRPDVWFDVNNMAPTPIGTYHTMPCFSSNSTSGGRSGTGGEITARAWCTQIANGTAVTYVLSEDGAAVGSYVQTFTAGVFANKSPGGTNFPGLPSSYGAFAQMGNTTIYSSKADATYTRDASGAGNFASVSTSAGSILVVQSNALLMYDLLDGGSLKPNYWMASDLFNPANFTSGEAVSATPVVTTPGAITAAVPFAGVSIFFKRAGVYRHRYVGQTDVKWTVELLRPDIGVKSKHAVIDAGNSLVFLGEQGVWEYDGAVFRKLSEDMTTGFYLTSPLTAFLDCTASMYYPADDMCVWFTSTGCLFYNRRSQAFGRGTFYDINGTAMTGYVPIVGKVPAIAAAGYIPGANSYSFIEGITVVNVAAAKYQVSDQSWRGVNSAYVQTPESGDYQSDVTIYRAIPKLRRGQGAYTFNGGYVATDGLSVTVTNNSADTQTVNSSTERRRFDFGETIKFPRGGQLKIKSRGSGYNGVWEIEDLILEAKKTGAT